jgi:hypothetical protein
LDSVKRKRHPFEKKNEKSGDDQLWPSIAHRTAGACLVQDRHRFVKQKKEIGKKKNI